MKRGSGHLLEEYFAKVALVSGLALMEEKLKIHKKALKTRDKCLACKLPVSLNSEERGGYIICDSKGCGLVLKCNQLSCPGITHACHICHIMHACEPLDSGDKKPFILCCGACGKQTCKSEVCNSLCVRCEMDFVCSSCSPGPFAPRTRLWAGPQSKEYQEEIFCAKHLEEEYDAWAVLETCKDCVFDLRSKGYLTACRVCPLMRSRVVCQHTANGPGQIYCAEHSDKK